MFYNMSLGANAAQGVVIELKKQLSDPKLGYAAAERGRKR